MTLLLVCVFVTQPNEKDKMIKKVKHRLRDPESDFTKPRAAPLTIPAHADSEQSLLILATFITATSKLSENVAMLVDSLKCTVKFDFC